MYYCICGIIDQVAKRTDSITKSQLIDRIRIVLFLFMYQTYATDFEEISRPLWLLKLVSINKHSDTDISRFRPVALNYTRSYDLNKPNNFVLNELPFFHFILFISLNIYLFLTVKQTFSLYIIDYKSMTLCFNAIWQQ